MIAASLRASGVVPLRGGDDASTASRRRQKNGMKPWRTPRDAPLVDVELAGAVRVEVVQRLLEARGHEQKLQVLLAARLQEVDHVFVLLHGRDDLVRAQRAAAVLVDHLEALARGVLEIVRKFLDLLVGLLGLELALGRPFRELVREGDLDALLPARNVDR